MAAFVLGPEGITSGTGFFELPGIDGTDHGGALKAARYKEFFHGNASSFTRSFHVSNDFGNSRQGGCVMYMYSGWNADQVLWLCAMDKCGQQWWDHYGAAARSI